MVAATLAPQLAGYRDLTPLGRGGHSEVFRARQERFDRWVAVKVLTFPMTDEQVRRRFLRECRLAGRVSAHPHVVSVLDAGLADDRPYLVLELYEGGDLADRLADRGPLDPATALRTAVRLAGALESAHRAGVVHRDVKPGNVLLTGDGRPALSDFGVAVAAAHDGVAASTGLAAFSPHHAPPEVVHGAPPTPVGDVYSLAATTYTMLAGRPPHRLAPGEAPAALLARIARAEVPPLGRGDVPRSLDGALRAALARDPASRPPTALAFAAALRQVEAEMGLEPTEPIVLSDIASVRPTPPVSQTPDPGGWPASQPGDETVHRSKVPGTWPPAPAGGGSARRPRRWAALAVAGLLGIAAVGGGAQLAGAGGYGEDGGDRAGAGSPATTAPSTTAPPTTAPPTTATPTTAPATTIPPTTAPPTTAPPTTAPPPADLAITDASASATAPDSTDGCGETTGYGAANAADGARDTGWSVVGDATGETLTLALDGERRVLSVGLLPGYAKVDACTGVDRFPENRRPTSVTWRFDDGTVVSQTLEDTPELQAIDVDATTTTVELTIDGVTGEPRRDFTVISEVAVQGT